MLRFENMLIDNVSENTLLKEKENKMKLLLISLQMDYDSLVLGPVTVHTTPHLWVWSEVSPKNNKNNNNNS